MAKSKSTNRIMSTPEPMYCGASGGVSKEDRARQKKYQAEEDLRTLTRAEELKADANRVRAARALAREQAACLARIAK